MLEKVLFFAALIGFIYFSVRLPSRETVDGWTICFIIAMALVFGAAAGMSFESDKRKEMFDTFCEERAEGVYLCDYRGMADYGEPSHVGGGGKYND